MNKKIKILVQEIEAVNLWSTIVVLSQQNKKGIACNAQLKDVTEKFIRIANFEGTSWDESFAVRPVNASLIHKPTLGQLLYKLYMNI